MEHDPREIENEVSNILADMHRQIGGLGPGEGIDVRLYEIEVALRALARHLDEAFSEIRSHGHDD